MIQKLINIIQAATSEADGLKRVAPLVTELHQLEEADVDRLLDQLAAMAIAPDLSPVPDTDGQWKTRLDLLQPVIQGLLIRELKQSSAAKNTDDDASARWSDDRLNHFEALYLAVPPESPLQNHLLRWLASGDQRARLEQWVHLISQQPPEYRAGIALSFAPLMTVDFQPADWFLESMLQEGTRHSQLAPAIFDLCNFYFRNGQTPTHPAIDRLASLNQLMAQLCEKLAMVESGKVSPSIAPSQINRQVADSVALIVALCDTFALTAYEPAVDNIVQAMMLRHRRVQTEASAALARLGFPEGKQALVKLAQEPASRLRVLAYAEELGFLNEISLELQGEIAVAESKLAIWLAEPEQMGLAPSTIELIDNRELYWPSYEHPVQCYLFRFQYGHTANAYTNVGICGPLTHAMRADLRHLSAEDAYAMFAGWQTTHDEIFQMSVERAEQFQPSEMRRLKSLLHEQEIEDLQLQTAASFFGEVVLIGTGKIDQKPGSWVVDANDVTWVPAGSTAAPVDWELAFALWRGRRLLSTFNQEDSLSESE